MPNQTGPRTPEGKAKSAQNALKHGLTSNRMFVLANENEEKWNLILKVWTDELQPQSDAEFMIVTDIAHAQWKIRRARTLESGMLDLEMEDQFEEMAAIFKPPVDEGTRVACAFKGLGDKSRALDHLHRYETRARRAFKSGLAALAQLRALTAAQAPAAEKPQPEHTLQAETTPAQQPGPEAAKPMPAADRYPSMPKQLRHEFDSLHRTVPTGGEVSHSRRPSGSQKRTSLEGALLGMLSWHARATRVSLSPAVPPIAGIDFPGIAEAIPAG